MYGDNSVLEMQQVHNAGDDPGVLEGLGLGDAIDSTPRFVAGLVLGAMLTLLLLKVAGFRFAFGAQIGGGS
jgi:hypothetical protein